MANAKLKCVACKERFPREQMLKLPAGNVCSEECAIAYANKQREKQRAKAERKTKDDQKAVRANDRQRKKELMSRSQWYDKLQRLVNQFVIYRDRYEPCCTCKTSNPNIKYDAGHFIPQKGYDPRRFELTNLHKQCSMQCNQHGSGKRAEYREFIRNKYGQEHLDWLEADVNHRPLKEQFPHWTDIENEIKRYRALLREHGIKPNV